MNYDINLLGKTITIKKSWKFPYQTVNVFI